MRRSFGLLGCVFALGVAASPAQALVTYSTFGPGDTYNTLVGRPVGNDLFATYTFAMQFTALYGGQITSIRAAMFPGGSVEVDPIFRLRADSGGSLGAVMESWAFVAPASQDIVTVLNGSAAATLVAGTTYWLEMIPSSTTEFVGWNLSSPGVVARQSWTVNGGADNYSDIDIQSAFDINVSGPQSVPEPFTMALMGGAAAAGYRRLRRRQA